MATLKERVVERLRVEKDRLGLSEREIGELIGWTSSKVSQKLIGRTPITMDELEALCFALSLTPTEAVRDTGMEFCAEMTPTELRIHETIRKLTADQRAGLLQVLAIAHVEGRRALPKKAVPRGRQ